MSPRPVSAKAPPNRPWCDRRNSKVTSDAENYQEAHPPPIPIGQAPTWLRPIRCRADGSGLARCAGSKTCNSCPVGPVTCKSKTVCTRDGGD